MTRRTRRRVAIGIAVVAALALLAHLGGSGMMSALAGHLHGAR